VANRSFRVKKNREEAIRVLKIVIDVLDKHNIKYYLDFGTLIGAIRDKGLILWDDDIDISLLNQEDYKKIPDILKEIENNNNLRTYIYTFNSTKQKREKRGNKVYSQNVSFANMQDFQIAKVRTSKFLIFGRGNTCIDIFFKYKFENNIYWMAYGKENSVPIEYVSYEVIDIDFCGLKCKIPKEYDKYLTYKYGDWKTPKENWNHEDDDFSINN